MKPQKPGEPETLPSCFPILTLSPPIPSLCPTKFSPNPLLTLLFLSST